MKYLTTKLLILLLFFLAIISAYNYFKKPFLSDVSQNSDVKESIATTPTPSKIVKKDLNTRQKIAQLLAVPLDINELEESSTASARMIAFIKENQPGFVIYFGDQISTTAAILAKQTITNNFTEFDYVPLVAVDHEGGLVQRLNGEGFLKLDPWQKIVYDYSLSQQKAVFNQSAKELRSVGVNIVFAPVVDLASGSGVLQTRAGANLEQTFVATNNFILSFSQHSIMPVIKHFPGIGAISIDPHRAVSTISLREGDTAIFSRVLDKFPNIGVMNAHVRIKDKLFGKVCSLSEECLKEFPKTYPNVLLFTDDLTMKSALAQIGSTELKDPSEVAVEAIEAGNDVLVFGKGVAKPILENTINALEAKYNDSESFRAKVDQSVAKILKLKK